MPLYQYTCTECAHEFEALVFNGEEVECPKCQSRRLDRQWGVPARPRETTALPSAGCDSSLPPCGPACRRWQG